MTKKCSVCSQTKPITNFYDDTRATDKKASKCKLCQRAATYSWRSRNPGSVKRLQAAYRKRNKSLLASRRRNYYLNNRDKALENAYKNVQKTKDAAYRQYGGYTCSCCREDEKAFLCLDHVNNDGYKHRQEMKRTSGQSVYAWLKANKYPPGMFQVLCYNCNQGKRINKGVCPHGLRIVEVQ